MLPRGKLPVVVVAAALARRRSHGRDIGEEVSASLSRVRLSLIRTRIRMKHPNGLLRDAPGVVAAVAGASSGQVGSLGQCQGG